MGFEVNPESEVSKENMPKERTPVNREDYVEVGVGDGCRCVDDRAGKGESDLANLAPQLPGGSEHVMDLILLASLKAGKSVTEDELFQMVEDVYKSGAAQKYGLKPGLHIDDEHGHISDPIELEKRDIGCGADSVRVEVLRKMGVEVEYDRGARIREARRRGWNVQILTGHHAGAEGEEQATAAVNHMVGKTLNTNSLLSPDRRASFNYDVWVVELLIPEMVNLMRNRGMGEAANLLERNGLSWGEEIFVHTLTELGQSGKTVAIQ
ncbi:MAG: hypothetical protein UY18_C0026G0001 [Microgenomates group bacterium GW2011_GWF2_47_9]|nr:MAG: hypothetical protein UY18_C0026G0001 [Microgenomates group bacterium GW2011_GWF2_47_9]